jgi:hypothetical protein
MRTTTATVTFAACLLMGSGCLENGLGGKHTATSLLRVHWHIPWIATPPAHQDTAPEFQTYKITQQQLIKSQFVLLAALRKPDVARLPSVQASQTGGDAVRWLESLVKVEFPGDAEIMSVSVSHSDPIVATTLARAVVGAYLSEVVNAERNARRERLSELDRAYVEKESEVRGKKEAVKKLIKEIAAGGDKNAPFPLPVDIEMMQADIKGLEQILGEVRIERERARVEIRAKPRVTLLQRADTPAEYTQRGHFPRVCVNNILRPKRKRGNGLRASLALRVSIVCAR